MIDVHVVTCQYAEYFAATLENQFFGGENMVWS